MSSHFLNKIRRKLKTRTLDYKLDRQENDIEGFSSASSTPTRKSALLALPAEVRLMIYRGIFEYNADHHFPAPRIDLPENQQALKPHRHFAPLLTCRKIYEESRELAFQNYVFSITLDQERLPARNFTPVGKVASRRKRLTQGYESLCKSSAHVFISHLTLEGLAVAVLFGLDSVKDNSETNIPFFKVYAFPNVTTVAMTTRAGVSERLHARALSGIVSSLPRLQAVAIVAVLDPRESLSSVIRDIYKPHLDEYLLRKATLVYLEHKGDEHDCGRDGLLALSLAGRPALGESAGKDGVGSLAIGHAHVYVQWEGQVITRLRESAVRNKECFRPDVPKVKSSWDWLVIFVHMY